MEHLPSVWFLLAAASAGVFLHAGIKFPWFVFFQKDSGLRPPDPPWNMRLAMLFLAALCIGLGIAPGPLYAILPFEVDYVPYTFAHVVYQLQLLLFSGLAFFLMLPWLKRTLTITLDFDWFYRGGGRRLAAAVSDTCNGLAGALSRGPGHLTQRLLDRLNAYHGPDGLLARAWQTSDMAFWTGVVLAAYLLFLYV